MSEKSYHDIPGTFVFDAEQAQRGYHLNMFCMSLTKQENRKAFKAHEAAYLDCYPLSENQRRAVLALDQNGMLSDGGNIFHVANIAATDGMSYQALSATMTGTPLEEYAQMVLSGGRSVEGNSSKKDGKGG